MAYRAKTYTLKAELPEDGTRYFISFKDGQGEHHELEVSAIYARLDHLRKKLRKIL